MKYRIMMLVAMFVVPASNMFASIRWQGVQETVCSIQWQGIIANTASLVWTLM